MEEEDDQSLLQEKASTPGKDKTCSIKTEDANVTSESDDTKTDEGVENKKSETDKAKPDVKNEATNVAKNEEKAGDKTDESESDSKKDDTKPDVKNNDAKPDVKKAKTDAKNEEKADDKIDVPESDSKNEEARPDVKTDKEKSNSKDDDGKQDFKEDKDAKQLPRQDTTEQGKLKEDDSQSADQKDAAAASDMKNKHDEEEAPYDLEKYLNDTFDSVLDDSLNAEEISEKQKSLSELGNARQIEEEGFDDEGRSSSRSSDVPENASENDVAMVVANADPEEPLSPTKHKLSESEINPDDLDFSVIESNNTPLDLDASKQKSVLRKKGTLGKRRKPTRSSVRSSVTSDNDDRMFEDSTEPRSSRPSSLYSQDSDVFDSDKEKHKSPSPQKEDIPESPLARTGRPMPGIKSPIALPGMLDGKPKLRKTGNLPKPMDISPTKEAEPEPPKWLSESKLKKTISPQREETTEKIEEDDSNKPAWMKDALQKRRKVADIIMNSQQDIKKDENANVEENEPKAPWMKDLKKSNRISPLRAVHTDTSNVQNSNTNNANNELQNKFSALRNRQSSVEKEPLIIEKEKEKEMITSPPKWGSQKHTITETNIISTISLKHVDHFKSSPSGSKLKPIGHKDRESHVEQKTPEKSSTVKDENTPPKKSTSPAKETFVIDKESKDSVLPFPGSKTVLPPLRSHVPASSSSSSPRDHPSKNSPRDSPRGTDHTLKEDLDLPAWKLEVERRKHQPQPHFPLRTGQPIKMAETPQWKRDLLKHRQRRGSDSSRTSEDEAPPSTSTPAKKETTTGSRFSASPTNMGSSFGSMGASYGSPKPWKSSSTTTSSPSKITDTAVSSSASPEKNTAISGSANATPVKTSEPTPGKSGTDSPVNKRATPRSNTSTPINKSATPGTSAITPQTTPGESSSNTSTPGSGVPSWKLEFAERRKRQSSPSSRVFKSEKKSEEPEWKKQAEERRIRLAKSGILNEPSFDN